MKLDYKTLKGITFGAEEVKENENGFSFLRFTGKEIEVYRGENGNINVNALSAANVRLSFITDTEKIKIQCILSEGSARSYGYFDIYTDGILTNHFGTDNFNDEKFNFDASLEKGRKHIEIYFPWSLCVKEFAIEIDDDAYIMPIARQGKIICYGDSITQGFDAEFPSLSYSNQIARMFDMDSINKAIGGAAFEPELLGDKKNADADVVTVAYGTNDWTRYDYDEFQHKCKSFMERLTKIYKKAKIYVITPIWRGDSDMETKMGIPHENVGLVIEDICKAYSSITVINGRQLTPHEPSFYWDTRLHPNDMGFLLYSNNLYCSLKG